jgi:O-antigen ligase/tetratricopeptide (TPR) repeat protein
MPDMTSAEKILRWIVIGGVFLLPTVALIVADNLFFPYITGKSFVFRVVVEIITGAWLALAICVPRYRPRRTIIIAAFALFVVIIAIADAQGVNAFKSFWSNFERMDGWITVAHTFLFALVAACVLDTEKLWRRFFQWSLIVSVYISLYGLSDVITGAGATTLQSRIDLTFGNPIYLAAYMLFHIFIAALLWQQMWIANGKGKRLWLSVMYGAVIFLDTAALLLTGTRGTMLGLIGGALVALFLFACSTDASRRFRTVSVGIFAAMVVLGGGLWLARATPFVQSVGFLNRLSSISLSDDTTMARLLNIQIAWKGIQERPILGWGQENYAIVFDKYYDPRMYAQEQWFDRVHNIVFDWWIAGGTLGLLSYLSIFVATLWVLWRPSKERASEAKVSKSAFTNAERSILSGLLVGYFIHNLTVFDNVTSYILFAMILGYICYREHLARDVPLLFEGEMVPKSTLPVVAVVAIIVALGSAWAVNANAYAANQTILAAISPQQGGIADNLKLFQQAISYGTYGTQEAREQLSQAAMQIAQSSSVPDSVKQQYVQTAVNELDLQAKQSPLDARFPLFAGTVLDSAGDYSDAQSQLERAHELAPNKQTILFELAENAQLNGDKATMVNDFKEAYYLDTDYTDALVYYAEALIRAGQAPQAVSLLTQAHVPVTAGNAQNLITIAAIYYSAHDLTDAISTLQAVGGLSPSLKLQADQYIQEVKNGTVPTQ